MSPLTRKQEGGALYYQMQRHRLAGRQLWRQMNDATPSAHTEIRSAVDSAMDRSLSGIQMFSHIYYDLWTHPLPRLDMFSLSHLQMHPYFIYLYSIKHVV